jgi:hypothetical protein
MINVIPNVSNWRDWAGKVMPPGPKPGEQVGTQWIVVAVVEGTQARQGDIIQLIENDLSGLPWFENLTTGLKKFPLFWYCLAPFDAINSPKIEHFNPPTNTEINVGTPYYLPPLNGGIIHHNMSNNNIFTQAKDLVKSVFMTEPEKSLQESGLETTDGTPTDLGIAMMQLEAWKAYRSSEACQSLVKAFIEKRKRDEKKD